MDRTGPPLLLLFSVTFLNPICFLYFCSHRCVCVFVFRTRATLIDRLVTCGMCDQFLLIKFSFSFNLSFSPRAIPSQAGPSPSVMHPGGFSWLVVFFSSLFPAEAAASVICALSLVVVVILWLLKRSSFPYPFILYQPATVCRDDSKLGPEGSPPGRENQAKSLVEVFFRKKPL